MDFTTVVRRRRSIRSYAPDVPEAELVDRLIDTARRAPTAGFSQGVDFLVVDGQGEIQEFWSIVAGPGEDPHAPDHPPVVVLVWSDPRRYLDRYSAPDKIEFGLDREDAWPVRFWDVDAAMAAMQLQLAAVAEGLGTWFFGLGHGEDQVRQRFDVPEDRRLVGVIALGYRAGDERPVGSGTTRRRRPLEEQLHRNGW